MIPQKSFIADNIRLSSIHTDKFKTESLTVSLSLPVTKRDYLLGLVLSGVMRRGCERFPTMAHINRQLDELYASTLDIQSSTYAGSLSLVLSAELIDSAFAIDGTDIVGGVTELMADMLLRPKNENGIFPRTTVESEIALVKDALLAEKNNTRAYAATRCRELMSRGRDTYPTLEYLVSNVESVTSEELTDYYRRLLSSAPLSVFYVGREDRSNIAKKILSAFDGYSGKAVPVFEKRKPASPLEFVSVTEDMPVSQGKLVLGMRTGAAIANGKHAAAIVLNEILGASPASKLFLNVRERLGLCYYCSSSYSMTSGNLTVSSGIDVGNKDRTVKEILAQIDELKKGNISDTEFSAARKSLEYSYVQIYDSPFSLQGFYSGREILGIDETVDECKQKLLAVTKQEICELAKDITLDTCFFINGISANAGDGEEDEND
ncbi:MAG: insulinase family protein [Clostridia bacterium]|nr:insulinase family protein [Clostridia bacterium]